MVILRPAVFIFVHLKVFEIGMVRPLSKVILGVIMPGGWFE